MRYFYEKPNEYECVHGIVHHCDHPLFDLCTLYSCDGIGLAVVQQRFDPARKTLSWGPIDPWLANDIHNQEGFENYFKEHAGKENDHGCYPTVAVRKIMWALRMKPIKREAWEREL